MRPKPSKHRSKRLRKKLHIDEFQAMGFELKYTLKPDIDHDGAGKIMDAFIDEAIEANNLFCGGGGGRLEYHYCVEKGLKSVSEEERAAVTSWLSEQKDIESYTVGPMVDSWYYDEDEDVLTKAA